jgi:hypothetical protein
MSKRCGSRSCPGVEFHSVAPTTRPFRLGDCTSPDPPAFQPRIGTRSSSSDVSSHFGTLGMSNPLAAVRRRERMRHATNWLTASPNSPSFRHELGISLSVDRPNPGELHGHIPQRFGRTLRTPACAPTDRTARSSLRGAAVFCSGISQSHVVLAAAVSPTATSVSADSFPSFQPATNVSVQ